MDENRCEDEFADRLGWILLRAYADGIDVTGEWYLLNVHDEIPDAIVEVEASSTSARSLDCETDGQAIEDFKSDLDSFLLREFGSGTTISGTWQVRFNARVLPAWNATIRLPDLEADDQFVRGRNPYVR